MITHQETEHPHQISLSKRPHYRLLSLRNVIKHWWVANWATWSKVGDQTAPGLLSVCVSDVCKWANETGQTLNSKKSKMCSKNRECEWGGSNRERADRRSVGPSNRPVAWQTDLRRLRDGSHSHPPPAFLSHPSFPLWTDSTTSTRTYYSGTDSGRCQRRLRPLGPTSRTRPQEIPRSLLLDPQAVRTPLHQHQDCLYSTQAHYLYRGRLPPPKAMPPRWKGRRLRANVHGWRPSSLFCPGYSDVAKLRYPGNTFFYRNITFLSLVSASSYSSW